jgi:SAM-dependent methyltransferase
VNQKPARQAVDADRTRLEAADEELRRRQPLIPTDEAAFYDAIGQRNVVDLEASDAAQELRALLAVGGEVGATFPEPRELWIDSPYESRAQLAGYRRLAPIAGRVALQLGGSGSHAVKFLLAGASYAWLCSPVDSELRFGEALADFAGVLSRFRAVRGYGEAVPLADEAIDVAYSGGCLHHMDVPMAMSEVRRILKPGGVYAAMDPWASPGYYLGIRIFGKRECEVHCLPLTRQRLAGVDSWPGLSVERYGGLLRYQAIVMQRLGIPVSRRGTWAIADVDDFLRRWIPPMRYFASIALVSYTKPFEGSPGFSTPGADGGRT